MGTNHAPWCNKEHQPGATACARIVPGTPRGPFTVADNLFKEPPNGLDFYVCTECCCAVPVGYMSGHLAWHNKVADL